MCWNMKPQVWVVKLQFWDDALWFSNTWGGRPVNMLQLWSDKWYFRSQITTLITLRGLECSCGRKNLYFCYVEKYRLKYNSVTERRPNLQEGTVFIYVCHVMFHIRKNLILFSLNFIKSIKPIELIWKTMIASLDWSCLVIIEIVADNSYLQLILLSQGNFFLMYSSLEVMHELIFSVPSVIWISSICQ